MTFHWQHGWTFQRTENGDVIVCKNQNAPDEPPLITAKIPAAEWCSIVAAVSGDGETSESYAAAVAFHAGSS